MKAAVFQGAGQPLVVRSIDTPLAGKPIWRRAMRTHQCKVPLSPWGLAAEGGRQGLEDLDTGQVRPAREVFDEMRAEHSLPR